MGNGLSFGRAFMGDSLAFHIIFALFGVGIPLMICLAEFWGIVRKDNTYILMAKRWTFLMAILFVAGAVSGTAVAIIMTLLWPKFMAIAMPVVGIAFYLETGAFFIEAIFLGIYVYGWDKFKNAWLHWLTSLPIVIASAASAFLITTVNSFMSQPQGFVYQNGGVSDVNPWKAMFNIATPTRTTHSIFAYYATTALVLAGIYAILLWRRQTCGEMVSRFYKKVIIFCTVIGLIAAIGVGMSGDRSASYIAHHEPIKFAASEGIMVSTTDAPLRFFDITIPHGLTNLLGVSNTTVVRGLNAFNPDLWPPLVIHYFFDIMALSGVFIIVIPIIFLLLLLFKRRSAFSPLMLVMLLLSGIAAVASVEFGWMLTEIGRQPYIINGLLLTKDAFTTSRGVAEFAIVFPVFYLILAIVTIWVLIKYYKKHPLESELLP